MSSEPRARANHFGILDALRFVLALWVAIGHYAIFPLFAGADPQSQHESQGIQDAVMIRPSARFAAHVLDTAGSWAGLNAVGNGGLHAIEKKEAAEDDEGDGESGNEKEKAGSLAAAGDGPAETINDASHGVEAVEPTPAGRNERGRIGDGRGKHPKLDEEGNDVADVAIKSVERE